MRYFSGKNTADIRILAVIASLCISAWIACTKDVINGDGIVYVSAAKLIAAGDWSGSCEIPTLCWLLYPSLIAFTGELTGLGLENAAYLLDAAFSALMVYVFLTLVRDLGAGRRILMFAALVILLHPYLNESRAAIIRDHGYWAFYLMAVLFFIRYWRYPGWENAIAWGAAAAVATFFRIEGIVFLLLLPMVLLVQQSRRLPDRLLIFFKAHAFTGILVTGLLGWWALDPAFTVEQTGRLLEPVQRLTEIWTQLHSGLENRVQVMGEGVLGEYLDRYALSALWATLGFILLAKVFSTLSPLYSLLLLCKRCRSRFKPSAGIWRILTWLILLNLGILVVELLTRFLLSGRFAVPLALTLLLIIPFALNALYEQWQTRQENPVQKWFLLPAIFGALLFMSLDGLFSLDSDSKAYLRNAGHWLRDQDVPDTKVFSNNLRVVYYSGQQVNWTRRLTTSDLVRRERWRQYDYIAIQINGDDLSLREEAGAALGVPVQEFHNSQQDSVLIYKTAATL